MYDVMNDFQISSQEQGAAQDSPLVPLMFLLTANSFVTALFLGLDVSKLITHW